MLKIGRLIRSTTMADGPSQKTRKLDPPKNDKAQSEEGASGASGHKPGTGFVELPLDILCEVLCPTPLTQSSLSALIRQADLQASSSSGLAPACADSLLRPKVSDGPGFEIRVDVYSIDC
jgi:hypothetical protein